MQPVVITLRTPDIGGAIDLELPGDVEVQQLLPGLLRALQLPKTNQTGSQIIYRLIRERRRRSLRPAETLLDAGVNTGDYLALQSSASPGQIHRQGRGSHAQRSSTLLRSSASGMIFALDNYSKQDLEIGRYDARTGKYPDIDLSHEPHGNTVSRSHALLRKQGEQWILIPVSIKNSTVVDGNPIPNQQPYPLQPGNIITLGGVELTFKVGGF
jgi:hypothetical protein